MNKWTTFLKARMVCSVLEEDGTETHFDELGEQKLCSQTAAILGQGMLFFPQQFLEILYFSSIRAVF